MLLPTGLKTRLVIRTSLREVFCFILPINTTELSKLIYPIIKGMCWFHMRKSAEKQLSIISSKETRTKIMQDIDALQKFPSSNHFDAACVLFVKKWKCEKEAGVTEYLAYFETEWLKVKQVLFFNYIFS